MYEQNDSIDIKTSFNGIISQRKIDLVCLISVILISGLWAFLTFDKIAPVTEGWYAVYAEMILAGETPYLDFELLYPPLYTYMSTMVVAVFGNGLFAFRVIGALLFISIAAMSYIFFREFLPSWIAALGAIITVFVLQADVFYVSYDYHSFFILFGYISGILMLRVILRLYRGQDFRIGLNLFMVGITCAVAALIRPQSGAVVLVYFILSLIFIRFVLKIRISSKDTCCFFIGIFIPILLTGVLLMSAGALMPAIDSIFFGGSKGSFTSMLFGWTSDLESNIFPIAFLSLPYLMYITIKRRANTETRTGMLDYILYFVSFAIMFVFIVVMFKSIDTSLDVVHYYRRVQATLLIIGIVVALTLLCKIMIKSHRKDDLSQFDIASLFVGGFSLSVAYGSLTSGGFGYLGIAMVFGFITGVLLYHSVELPITNVKKCVKMFSLLFVIFIVATHVSAKVVTPYAWWGGSTSPYQYSLYETDIEYFDGIKLSAEEKYMYEDFVGNADLYLEHDDELYCYANIPVFYILADKLPTVKSPIPWFDVSRTSTIYEDLEYLKNNNPKMIVFNDHGESAMEIHDEDYGGKPAHRELYHWLLDCKDGNGYTVLSTYDGAYTTYLLLRS